MWILNQTKTQLFNTDTITGIGIGTSDFEDFRLLLYVPKGTHTLGIYSSKEQCDKVLEDIMHNLEEECMTVDLFSVSCMSHVPYVRQQKTIFRMPEDKSNE